MVKARYDLGNKTLHCPYTFFLSLVDPTHHINTVPHGQCFLRHRKWPFIVSEHGNMHGCTNIMCRDKTFSHEGSVCLLESNFF